MPAMDLRKDVLLLAGSSGRLGGAIAQRVLANGGRVAAAVRRPWQVARVHDLLGRERVLVGVVEPRDTEAAAGFVKGAQDALGPITAFVGAAGAWQAADRGREPGAELVPMLEANLLANATLARAVLPFLRRRRRGALTFFGAAPAALAAGSTAFAASKAAVHELVISLARDLADAGVRAAAVLLAADTHGDDAALARIVDEVVVLSFGLDPIAAREPLVTLPS
jgi:NADP-dependent 3-hydroxy acid dehydrogenase YdfG